jgi:CheY-like chemotaxis protein
MTDFSAQNSFMLFITDDDSQDRFFLTEALSKKINRVEFKEFENGQALMENLNAEGPLPDLILLDLNMPVMNGYQALSEIKQQPVFKDIPVIIFTASSRPQDQDRCFELGCEKYITKPFSYDEYDQLADDIILFLGDGHRQKAS